MLSRRAVQLTLVPITFGVGYATVYDLSLNTLGLLFALCGVIATAMAQILTNTHQRTLSCDALQLLYHTSPWIALGMLLMCPLFDSLPALHAYTFTGPCVARIALSCVFALGVNISNYLVLGKTSPLTYQVKFLLLISHHLSLTAAAGLGAHEDHPYSNPGHRHVQEALGHEEYLGRHHCDDRVSYCPSYPLNPA